MKDREDLTTLMQKTIHRYNVQAILLCEPNMDKEMEKQYIEANLYDGIHYKWKRFYNVMEKVTTVMGLKCPGVMEKLLEVEDVEPVCQDTHRREHGRHCTRKCIDRAAGCPTCGGRWHPHGICEGWRK